MILILRILIHVLPGVLLSCSILLLHDRAALLFWGVHGILQARFLLPQLGGGHRLPLHLR
jgi:hypothetical protein